MKQKSLSAKFSHKLCFQLYEQREAITAGKGKWHTENAATEWEEF